MVHIGSESIRRESALGGGEGGGVCLLYTRAAKMAKYEERCAAEAICFIPLAVDTFGGWHGAAPDVIAKLGRQLARQLGKEEEEVTMQLRQRLSILLTRDNMAMLGSRTPTLPPATIDGDFGGGDEDEFLQH